MEEPMVSMIVPVVRWYRDQDFSEMRADVAKDVQSAFYPDDQEPSYSASLQISTNVLLMGMVFKDERLVELSYQSHAARTKTELNGILNQLSLLLKESKFQIEV